MEMINDVIPLHRNCEKSANSRPAGHSAASDVQSSNSSTKDYGATQSNCPSDLVLLLRHLKILACIVSLPSRLLRLQLCQQLLNLIFLLQRRQPVLDIIGSDL